MNYILLHNIESNLKEQIINNYLDDEYKIIYKDQDNILIKKGNINLIDEEKYISILFSILKRRKDINNSKGKIINLTKAFEYAQKKGKYNIFNNKFDWYIRNIVIKEISN